MNVNFDLSLPKFIPATKGLPVINLYSAFNPFINFKLNKISLFERDYDSQEKLKLLIREYLSLSSLITNQNIIFGFGSYSILERLAWKFLPKGLMIGEFPQFRYFPMEYRLAGGNYLPLFNLDFSLPTEKILDLIKTKKISVIYLNNPSNPTGKTYLKKDLINIIQTAECKKIYVIIDEAYADLLPSSFSCASFVEKYNNLIVTRSFSKIFGLNNLRIGYMIASKKICRQYQKICNWEEITNVGVYFAKKILENKNILSNLRKLNCDLKPKIITSFRNKGFEILSSDPNVPLFLIKKPNINLEKYFQKINIRVKGSKRYRLLMRNFPNCYARIRVPTDKQMISRLNNRLIKTQK